MGAHGRSRLANVQKESDASSPNAGARRQRTARRRADLPLSALPGPRVVPDPLAPDQAGRAALKQQHPGCLWLTGLSGSGKSTIAALVEAQLHGAGRHTYVLDGDALRSGLNADLGFSVADRVESIRRAAQVARLMTDAGLIVIVSLISPFRAERALARSLFAPGQFSEVFVDAPLEECIRRDPKGMYKRALAGQLPSFTGIDSPYEAPLAPEVHLRTAHATPQSCAQALLAQWAGASSRPA